MRGGRTYTGHFQMQNDTRQHELLGLDLGEGVPRRALVLGTLVSLVWAGLLFPILGAPGKGTFSLYFLPPILLVTYGMQPSSRFLSRRRHTDWALRAHYLLRGHRPLIRLGARAADRSEYLPIRDRFAEGVVDNALRLLTWRHVRGVEEEDASAPDEQDAEGVDHRPEVAAGRPIRLVQRARLLDQQQLFRAYRRAYRRRGAGASLAPAEADIPAGISHSNGGTR